MITCQKVTWEITASVNYNFGNKTRFFSGLLIATSWFLILAKALRNGYVVVSSTPRGGTTAKNEMDGHGNVPCLAKMTQHSSTADWIKF